jgi:hypothetical protein
VPIIDIGFANAAPDNHYANMRTYIWWKMREALQVGLAIEESPELETELTAPEYAHNNRDQLALEKKSDLKKRIGVSPDDGDALALTFAMPVMKLKHQDQGVKTGWDPYTGEQQQTREWDPYA